MASVKVAVRVRPLNKREKDIGGSLIVAMEGETTCITNTRLPSSGSANDSLGRERVKQFTYDHSYWSVDPQDANYAAQEKIFQDLGCDVVKSAYEGYNACVFAYGQTGSGKTYTMMGSPENFGLIPRICEHLFDEMDEIDTTYRTEVSYLEIYNEKVRDLLRDKRQPQLNLRVREHPKDGPYVQDLTKHLVMNYDDVEELIGRGNANRTTAATNMNDHSSRSHAIFTIYFSQAKFADDLPSEVNSKINLVDLAGSERADSAGTKGDRLKEGSSINKSLVTLGNVISTLADYAEKLSSPKRNLFIPYRDSVLTWLLKDSLGGNAKTIMIATISPADCHYAETLSTLRYAHRAKRIINKPVINEDPNVKLIRELRAENARLLALLGQNVDCMVNQEKFKRNEEKVRELTEQWTDKWQETASVLQEHRMLALRQEGMGVVLDSELPYLLSIDNSVLSTGMKLYHLKEGDTRVGREDAGTEQDIVLSGPFIEAEHCIFRHDSSEVVLLPLDGALCSVNNKRIHDETTKLNQGAMIRLGKQHLFRFNHPGEAAMLREQLKGSGSTELIRVWRDFQWSWSSLSINDSALGSDLESELKDPGSEEFERLEEKRRQLQQLEEEHCLAEARRLAQVAAQQAKEADLEEKEQELHNLSQEAHCMKQKADKAQEEIKRLSQSFKEEVGRHLRQREQLEEQQEDLLKEKTRVEKEKAKAREERQRIRKERQLQRAKLQLQEERQEEEWAELKGQRRHLESRRLLQERQLQKRKAQLQEEQAVSDVYQQDMAEMREFLHTEVRDLRRLAGLPDTDANQTPDGAAADDDSFDLSQYILKLDEADGGRTGPVLPLEYLQRSPGDAPSTETTLSAAFLLDEDGDIMENLDRLALQVSEIHTRVCESLHRKYNSVLRSDDTTSGLDDEVLTRFANIRPIFEHIEKLVLKHSLDKEVTEKLKDYDRVLSIVDKFLQIHGVFKAIDSYMQSKDFLKAIEQLDAAVNLLGSLDIEEETELNVQKVLQTEACILREKLLFDLGETWNNLLKWTLPLESRRHAAKPRTVLLEARNIQESKKVLRDTVQAMHSMNMLDSRLKTFCDKMMMYFTEPIIRDRNTLLQVMEESSKCILCVTVLPVARSATPRVAVPPGEAYQKLEEIFLFINKPIEDIVVHEREDKLDGKPRPVYLTEKMGKVFCKRLFQCIYEECLSLSIPRNNRQFEKFNEILLQTEEFQEMLTRLKFLTPEYSSLMDYMNNVNSLFANIKSQEILKKAHEFMTQELMPSVQISSDHPLGIAPKGHENPARDRFVKECREKAGTSTYKLPTCQISIPVRSLMSLAYDTTKEAMSSSQEGAFNLCHSIQNMFELYCDVVPSYHREKLTNMPLVAALHHNNCMFVAHHLITVDKTFQQKLCGMPTGKESKLGDLVPKVRKLGNDDFSEHIGVKKGQLEDHLSDAEGFSCIADDQGKGAMRAVRHMLNHLKHISSIWRDVLPTNVFCKAVGRLLNAAITEIIDSVLSIEEFSAEDCEYLQHVLNKIIEVSPDYFKLEDSSTSPQVTIHENVTNWMKFKELVLVLSSSMQAVSDRWADGKGPLALYFQAEEVKKLVVAMFENTSRRDTLLGQLR